MRVLARHCCGLSGTQFLATTRVGLSERTISKALLLHSTIMVKMWVVRKPVQKPKPILPKINRHVPFRWEVTRSPVHHCTRQKKKFRAMDQFKLVRDLDTRHSFFSTDCGSDFLCAAPCVWYNTYIKLLVYTTSESRETTNLLRPSLILGEREVNICVTGHPVALFPNSVPLWIYRKGQLQHSLLIFNTPLIGSVPLLRGTIKCRGINSCNMAGLSCQASSLH